MENKKTISFVPVVSPKRLISLQTIKARVDPVTVLSVIDGCISFYKVELILIVVSKIINNEIRNKMYLKKFKHLQKYINPTNFIVLKDIELLFKII